MSYPKDNPRSKHDLCCPTVISTALANGSSTPIATLEALTSHLLQSSSEQQQQQQPPSLPPRLATVYTYKDAPTKPKPLSGKLRIDGLMTRSLFQRVVVAPQLSNGGITKCTMAVKLPSTIQQYKHDDINKYHADSNNTQSFAKFLRRLDESGSVATLAYDSAGRIAFLIPMDTNSENEQYAAMLYVAPMKEFLVHVEQNCALSEQQQQQDDEEEKVPATWTPQYTPPPEGQYHPSSEWDDDNDGSRIITDINHHHDVSITTTWTPQYTPPPEETCGPSSEWETNNNDTESNNNTTTGSSFIPPPDENNVPLFQPPESSDGTLFVPPGETDFSDGNNNNNAYGISGYGVLLDQDSNNNDQINNGTMMGEWSQLNKYDNNTNMKDGIYHTNAGAAAADAFYSNLTRSLDTRADSRLYHMRAFNGWVKATQIAELDPDIKSTSTSNGGKKRSRRSPLRVLDLACGKGGDLLKWSIHPRRMENYVGVDVARGSLVDAAVRARQMVKRGTLKRCTFSLADLGEDVPGRKRGRNAKRMQKLLTWNLEEETSEEREYDPKFVMKEGGGIAETDKFDVVSIQFAIHYMMSTRKRARRFFHTVSSLLEIGGNLIATTIDARVVIEKLMALGKDFHFDNADLHEDVDLPENESRHRNGNNARKVFEDGATVYAGDGVCRLKFDSDVLQKIFSPSKTSDDMYGLQYTFTLSEGDDHAAGVGDAVNLPEWLTPISALEELGKEAGLKLEYASNFHKFYEERKDPTQYTAAHNALYNMKVLNRNGSISEQEWDISRMYVAVKFQKVKESEIVIDDDDVGPDELID
eukprot:scaffold57386_cov66-Cyclotella_meneghiniana.AAC.10